MELIDVKKLKTFLASKVTMMTDYDNGICESCIDEYIDEFIAGQQTDIQCEDAVSRAEILRMINCINDHHAITPYKSVGAVTEHLTRIASNLPPVTPKQRTGKWILDRSGAYCCSKCMEPCASYVMMKPRDKFCKMCGAKMEGDANG